MMHAVPVLIVEDHPINLKLIRIVLADAGYQVHAAENAEQALQLLAKVRPRLILMDLQLPGMDGLELTRRLKADPATRDIPILALTAYAMNGDAAKGRAAGCDGYLTKPIDTHTFAETVASYLRAP